MRVRKRSEQGCELRNTNGVPIPGGSAICRPATGTQPGIHHFGEAMHMKYEKPAVQRFGTVREITLGAGQNTPGDATNLYHCS